MKLWYQPVFELVDESVHRTLSLKWFESLATTNKNSRYPFGYLLFLAEDEGFEPPRTESESGVLPLH